MAKKASRMIKGRPRAGPLAGVLLATMFALVMTAIVTSDTTLLSGQEFHVQEPAPMTVRIPLFNGYRDMLSGLGAREGAIVIQRGDLVSRSHITMISSIRSSEPDLTATWAAYCAAFFVLALLYTTYLRRSHRGKLLRVQAVTLALVVAVAMVVKVLMLTTSTSVLIVPVAAAALIAALAADLFAGIATALVAAFAIALLTPFDPGVVTVLGVQGIAAVLAMGDGRSKVRLATAGVVGAIGASLTYVVFYYLSWKITPVAELNTPLESAWIASIAGGLLSSVLAIVAYPVYQWMLGEITSSRLVTLADLSNPLLRQIAEKAPGTWQHSLAMANMAEVAAHSISANARLVRVGALYHDLGKSLQPKYYIENLAPGEQSPHDNLAPEVSCDAIHSHVTEGVRLGRKEGVPERIVDFMHMHHGDGLLEYFWSRCQEQNNPNGLSEEDFRYPGVRPASRETAILAICDAVEAASRTLKNPDAHAIENLVQRIVYGKLHLGQLDESGMSMADLRKVSNSLMETIKHAHHVRVEYPWQKEERAAKQRAADEQTTSKASRAARGGPAGEGRLATARIYREPPLDSLDVPRPYWRDRASSPPPDSAASVASESGQTSSDKLRPASQRPEGSASDPQQTDKTANPPPMAAAQLRASRGERPDTEPEVTDNDPDVVSSQESPAQETVSLRTLPPIQDAPHQPDRAAAAPAATTPDATPPAPDREHADGAVERDMPVTTTAKPGLEIIDDQASHADDSQGAPPQPATPRRAYARTISGHDLDPDQPTAQELRPTKPVEIPDIEPTPIVPRRRRPSPPPAPVPPRGRRAKATIELLKGEETPEDRPPARSESHRARSEDGLLAPGMMVLGPPPATLTRRSGARTEPTDDDELNELNELNDSPEDK